MPGLLRGVARTAVVAGTATAVGNGVSRRQSARWAEKDAQQGGGYAPAYLAPVQTVPQQQYAPAQAQYEAPPQAAIAAPDPIAQLQQLGELRTQGILTDAEFEAQKAKILAA